MDKPACPFCPSMPPTIPDDILQQSSGALFRRADLHLHSFGPGGSYDVANAGMTLEAIVDTALKENMEVIAITDHNAVGNVRRAVEQAKGKPVLVVPGVELSTPQGHLLIYCPTPELLEAFVGKLDISGDKKACSSPAWQCLKTAGDFGGFGICAHIDLDAGIEKAHPKFDTFKQQVFDSPNLLGLEIANSAACDWFAQADTSADRKQCATLRAERLGHEKGHELTKVMCSDAHSLGTPGRNAAGNRKLTRINSKLNTSCL